LGTEIRSIRHYLAEMSTVGKLASLSARDSMADPGQSNTGGPYLDFLSAALANASRVEESLRVLEEMSRLEGSNFFTPGIQQLRFRLYTVEKELAGKLSRQTIAKKVSGLYVIIDIGTLSGCNPLDVASEAIRGGARIIQLRDKCSCRKQILFLSRQLRALTAETGALYIVNDFVDVAIMSNADGVHVGQDDLPVSDIRKLLPINKLIGCSVASPEQAKLAEAAGADYIASQSVFPTPSKSDVNVIGTQGLKEIRAATRLPLVAIGGINVLNLSEVIAAGADSAAVISAVCRSPE